MTTLPIGQLKMTNDVFCEICMSKHTRRLSEFVYNNDKSEIEKIKSGLKQKAESEYTCRICKSIAG